MEKKFNNLPNSSIMNNEIKNSPFAVVDLLNCILVELNKVRDAILIISANLPQNRALNQKVELPAVLDTALMANELNISADTVRRLIRDSDQEKKLPAKKCGKGYYIGKEDFLKWRQTVFLGSH